MELRNLLTFRTVAETLSFTRAAESLSYAQSSVTAQIQALEAELGVPLFERLGKRVQLTSAGNQLLGYAKKLLLLEEEARLAVTSNDEPQGPLIIGAPESLCTYRLPAVLGKLRARHPKIQPIFRPGSCSDLRRAVAEGNLDLAFVMDLESPHPGVVNETLLAEPIRVLAHPQHPLSASANVTASDLKEETLLHVEAGCSYRSLFERAMAEAGVRNETVIEFSSIEAIKQCAMAGMGIAVLPEVAVRDELARGDLAELLWHREDFSVTTQMTWHKEKWLSPALSAFLEITREAFGEQRRDYGA
ncbi:HTH-type transcriptional regulator GltR [compost metagenome]